MKNQVPQQESIVIRCQLGDQQAWEELVLDWHPRLWRFIVRMIGDHSVAEDVLQSVWLRVVRSLGGLRAPEKLGGWIYQIARASVADRLRIQYRQPPTEPFGETMETDDELELVDVADQLANGLLSLHPCDREVVVLYYLEEFSLAEVSEACGIPPGTAKSRLHRARRIMRNTLENEESHYEIQ